MSILWALAPFPAGSARLSEVFNANCRSSTLSAIGDPLHAVPCGHLQPLLMFVSTHDLPAGHS